MTPTSGHTRTVSRGIAGLIVAAWLATAGCSDDAPAAQPQGQDCVIGLPADAQMFPPVIHTGFNGRDDFLGPISLNFVPDSWKVADPSIATVEQHEKCNPVFRGIGALVHPKKAGQTTITAVKNGMEFTLELYVADYTADEIDLGKKRYYEPENPSATRRACASCHQQPGGADHSPLAIGFYDDAIVRAVATTGMSPKCVSQVSGSECVCGGQDPGCYEIPEEQRVLNVPGGHSWEFTATELDAIVPYLRSLTPKGL